MTETKKEQAQRQATEAVDFLGRLFPKGSTVTTLVLHVSSSGMQRAIAVLAPSTDPDDRTAVMNVSWQVARALDMKLHRRHDGVLLNGAGMDMAFSLTYSLASKLHGDGYALRQRTLN